MNRRWRNVDDHQTIADPRRWPNWWRYSVTEEARRHCAGDSDATRMYILREHAKITDDDLVATVRALLDAWISAPDFTGYEIEVEDALINVSDAAIDEQDRRNVARRTDVIQETSP
jgi:hypothetical protein